MPLTKKQLLAVVLIMENDDNTVKKKKKVWVKEWLKNRDQCSDLNLLRELRTSSPDDYRNFLRMDENTFIKLLEMVRPFITKRDTKLRQAVSAEERLIATLR